MGKCIRCNNYCKDYHDYCLSCWNDLIGKCLSCNEDIIKDDNYAVGSKKYVVDNNEYLLLICENCYSKLIDKNKIIGICNDCQKEINSNEDYLLFNINNNQIYICKVCSNPDTIEENNQEEKDIRNKYETKYRTDDGHKVRSRGEVIIDNYLFKNNISHVYEKKVFNSQNIEEECTTDFYLPNYNIYIEFWGIENNKYYEKTKEYKENIYKINKYKKIDVYPNNIDNGLDDFLTKELMKLKNI